MSSEHKEPCKNQKPLSKITPACSHVVCVACKGMHKDRVTATSHWLTSNPSLLSMNSFEFWFCKILYIICIYFLALTCLKFSPMQKQLKNNTFFSMVCIFISLGSKTISCLLLQTRCILRFESECTANICIYSTLINSVQLDSLLSPCFSAAVTFCCDWWKHWTMCWHIKKLYLGCLTYLC